MIKSHSGTFFSRVENKKAMLPLYGVIELTYRCNIRCVHCYARGSENNGRELSTAEWKRVIEAVRKQGCLTLCFTGGEPLIRPDFWELYSFAKEKGFVVSLFTNGLLLEEPDLKRLSALPPNVIEITLNGITEQTYESITRAPGAFKRAIGAIKRIKELRLPLVIKANCLRQNKDELGKIKDFALGLLWRRPRKTYPFKYDPFIYPRLNGDRTPCAYRLSPEEIIRLWKEEPLVWKETKRLWAGCKQPPMTRNAPLYLCNAWQNNFFINPFGRLKFCMFTEDFSADLRRVTFEEGFYNFSNRVKGSRFTGRSRCRSCRSRAFCHLCPAKAKLETGDGQKPVPYFCELTRMTAEEMDVA